MKIDPYKNYIKESDSKRISNGYTWYTAIGLQQVDGLKTSDYLNDLVSKNISGDISFNEVESLIHSYYENKRDDNLETEESDKASVNIKKVLEDTSFIFSPTQYLSIHKQLFDNIFTHAGKMRKYNITKKEWVLNGDTVIYGGANILKETMEYDFNEEKLFDYSNLSKDEFIKHIARFISNIWQIHVFEEGNTRATAVFLIKYLRKFGYNVENLTFANNAWYFRNALVRANYTNIDKGIYETTKYLEIFLRNLLFNENNELKNRYLHIDWNEDQANNKMEDKCQSSKLKKHYNELLEKLNNKEYFSRAEIVEVLSLSERASSNLIAKLLENDLIVKVEGLGKGKYRFKK